MTDLLLLDYNGVIVDDEPLHYAALRDVLAIERITLDQVDYYESYLGLDDRECLRLAFRRERRSLEDGALDRLAARKAEWYGEMIRSGPPAVSGVTEFVREAASSGMRVGVVSGALRREIVSGLDRAGIGGIVGAVVSAEDVPQCKPSPAGYRLAIAQLADGAARRVRAVAVEDSLPGLAAARAAGIGCVMLATAYPAARMSGADAVWDTFAGHAPGELGPYLREVEAVGRV